MAAEIIIILNCFRIISLWVMIKCSKNYKIILEDIYKWKELLKISGKNFNCFSCLILFYKEFRNLIYVRCCVFAQVWIKLFFKPLDCLSVSTKDIGGGLFIQHGIGTIISAKSIGKNCWINQNVTIGYKKMNWFHRPLEIMLK